VAGFLAAPRPRVSERDRSTHARRAGLTDPGVRIRCLKPGSEVCVPFRMGLVDVVDPQPLVEPIHTPGEERSELVRNVVVSKRLVHPEEQSPGIASILPSILAQPVVARPGRSPGLRIRQGRQ
jgi:hypothetical protein